MAENQNKEFDFVVVGGGTAGLVLAARLSEDSAMSVAVIEAGKNLVEDQNILRPSLIHAMYGKPEYDWCFKTEPQVNYLPLNSTSSMSLTRCLGWSQWTLHLNAERKGPRWYECSQLSHGSLCDPS
jgi:choline dehydrogenase-like flavoprotein